MTMISNVGTSIYRDVQPAVYKGSFDSRLSPDNSFVLAVRSSISPEARDMYQNLKNPSMHETIQLSEKKDM